MQRERHHVQEENSCRGDLIQRERHHVEGETGCLPSCGMLPGQSTCSPLQCPLPTALHCTELNCTELNCTALHCTCHVLHCTSSRNRTPKVHLTTQSRLEAATRNSAGELCYTERHSGTWGLVAVNSQTITVYTVVQAFQSPLPCCPSCTVGNAQCTVYSILNIVYTLHYTVCNTHRTVYIEMCPVSSVQCRVQSVQQTEYSCVLLSPCSTYARHRPGLNIQRGLGGGMLNMRETVMGYTAVGYICNGIHCSGIHL